MSVDLYPALFESPLFDGIDDDELPLMLKCLQPIKARHEKGGYITIMGEHLRGIGVVVSGKAAVIKENAAGDRVVMTILEPGDLFGEMAAFASEPRWPATVQALEASIVFIISRDRIVGQCANACSWHETLIRNMLRIVTEKALVLNQKVMYLTIKSMRGRISAFLLDHYNRQSARTRKESARTKKNSVPINTIGAATKKEGPTILILPLNRNEMADFLGVSRPSMSRELGRMKEEGLIDFHLSTFRILDLDGLKRYASSV